MTLAAYTTTAFWDIPLQTDGRGRVAPGSVIILDSVLEAPAALALGVISATPPTLSGGQTTALAAGQGVAYGSRASVVLAMGLT